MPDENANAQDDAAKREALLRDFADRLHDSNERAQFALLTWELYRAQFPRGTARDQIDVAIGRLCGGQSHAEAQRRGEEKTGGKA